MADTYTTTASTNFVQTAYDRLAYFALRPQLYYDRVAEVQPVRQAMPGSSVVFTIENDLAVASTALNESTDVSAVALSTSQVTLTLNEYGNAAITTALLRGTAFVETDPVVADVIGYNAGRSIDEVIRVVLQAGTNVQYSTGTGTAPTSRATVTPTNTILSADVRLARAKLARSNVPQIGGAYVAYIHPDSVYDLVAETATISGWRAPHVYSQPDEIWQGEVGMFEGFRFIETPRAPVFADAGSSTTFTDVYGTLFLGRQALAKAWAQSDGNGEYPKVVPGPITDHLRRFVPFGWYWLGAYGVFRQAALYRNESASSIGANTTSGANTS